MLWLPGPAGESKWPVSETSAVSVFRLVGSRPTDDCTWLGSALSRDPFLALWCLAHASLEAAAQCRCSNDLARQIATTLAISERIKLQGASTGPADESIVESAVVGIVAASLVTASAKDKHAEPVGELAFLASLAEPGLQLARLSPGLVWPNWLQSAMDAANAAHTPPDEGHSIMRQAILAARGQRVAKSPFKSAQVRELRQTAQLAWSAEVPAAAWLVQQPATAAAAHAVALEAEKLAALAEFAAGAGHEINNPLAVISGRAQLLLREEPDLERRRELGLIHVQALRIHEMIADLMLFARPPAPRPRTCDAAELLDRLLVELTPRAELQGVQLVREGSAEPLPLVADPVQILVALKALADNALAVLPRGGTLVLGVGRVNAPGFTRANGRAAEQSAVRWIVRDDGPGIPDEVRRHLFDPFYSGRPAGRGLGVGASKCWRIVTAHGGKVDVSSAPAAGTTWEIILPAKGPPGPDGDGE